MGQGVLENPGMYLLSRGSLFFKIARRRSKKESWGGFGRHFF